MDKKEKIEKILKSIKIEVDNIDAFGKDVDAILGMFNEIGDVDVEGMSDTLNKKKITLSELREDEPKDWKFREDMRGKYFKAPNVSKRG